MKEDLTQQLLASLRHEDLEEAERLVLRGANLNPQNKGELNPIFAAIIDPLGWRVNKEKPEKQRKYIAFVHLLLKHGAKLGPREHNSGLNITIRLFRLAHSLGTENNDHSLFTSLIDSSKSDVKNLSHMLKILVEEQCNWPELLRGIEVLLENGAQSNITPEGMKMTAMEEAVYTSPQCLKPLLLMGGDPNVLCSQNLDSPAEPNPCTVFMKLVGVYFRSSRLCPDGTLEECNRRENELIELMIKKALPPVFLRDFKMNAFLQMRGKVHFVRGLYAILSSSEETSIKEKAVAKLLAQYNLYDLCKISQLLRNQNVLLFGAGIPPEVYRHIISYTSPSCACQKKR